MSTTRLLANILYAVFLVAGSLVTFPAGSDVGVPDGVLHGCAYGLQAALLAWLFASSMRARSAILAGVVCATLFGAMTEILQFVQPAREVELKDLLANAIGAVVAGTVIALAGRNRS